MARDSSNGGRESSELWTLLALACLGWFALNVAAYVHARSVGYGLSPKQALGFDFSSNVWYPAGQLLHGHGIYPTHVRGRVPNTVSVDPPFLAAVTTPLRLLPYPVALGIFEAIGFAAILASLCVLGVRDWRVYGIVIGSAPVMSNFVCGQVTGLIALGYAFAWRYRDRARVVGLVVGLLVALKLLAWPLIVWLVLSRRGRAAVVAAATGAALLVSSWSLIGFQGLTSYPHLLRASAASWARESYSVKAAALALGLHGSASGILGFTIAGLLAAWAVTAAIRGDDLASFAAAVAAGVYVSPVVHMHYALWLVVLVAIVRPRPHWIWLVVLAIWVSGSEPALSTWRLEAELGVAFTLIVYAVLPRARTDTLSLWAGIRVLRAVRSMG